MTPVAISSAGLVTAFAQDPATFHDVLCTDSRAPGRITTFSTAGLACDRGDAIDASVFTEALRTPPSAAIDRVGQLAIIAASRALDTAAFHDRVPGDLGLVLGTMFSGAHTIGEFDRRAQTAGPACASPLDFANTVLNAAAGQAAIRLSLRGINTTIAGGHTSGLQAIAYASDLIAAARAPALLAGGVEELALESYIGFCRAGLVCGTNGRPGHVPVPFDDARSGCALGEGAAFVLLEPASTAAGRGAVTRAYVRGSASLTDPDALLTGVCGSRVIADAIQFALDRAGVAPADVDAVSAAANGSYAADAEESEAVCAVFGGCQHPPAVTAIKSVVGEALGAAGPLQVIAMCEAIRTGRLPGIRGLRSTPDTPLATWISASTRALRIETALIVATNPEGSCCALVLGAPERRER